MSKINIVKSGRITKTGWALACCFSAAFTVPLLYHFHQINIFFDDLEKSFDKIEQSTDSLDATTDRYLKELNNFDNQLRELNEDMQDIPDLLQAHRALENGGYLDQDDPEDTFLQITVPDPVNLCRYRSRFACETHTMPDQRIIRVEFDNQATPRLIKTWIGLQNGTIESLFEELPPELEYLNEAPFQDLG
mgnify:CR=1 FL=1